LRKRGVGKREWLRGEELGEEVKGGEVKRRGEASRQREVKRRGGK